MSSSLLVLSGSLRMVMMSQNVDDEGKVVEKD